mgnify:CR=1 FL=1
MNAELEIYLIAFSISLLSSGAIFGLLRQRNQTGWDSLAGPQQIHQGAVPRIGGIAIIAGVSACFMFFQLPLLPLLTVVAMPVFLAGVVEDFTGSVSAKLRLVVSLISGCLFCWITGYQITGVGVDALGFLLAIPGISFVMTSLAVGAMVNALNIVDGLNGLAGATAILMIGSFGVLFGQSGDFELKIICFVLVFACLGFLLWNFPFGKIFLGDGGAYFLGALVAGIAVLLPERNDEISPFASLLIIIYPFYELVRSTTRRIVAIGIRALEPDDKHLHSLIYKCLSARGLMSKSTQNSLASVLVLMLPLLCCFWAVMFATERSMLISGILVFIFLYETAMASVLLIKSKNA